MRHACLRAPCVAWPLLLPSFSLSFFLSFFWPRRLACAMLAFFLSLFSLHLLLLTHFGESPVCEHLFPPIFWHNKKIYAKKKIGNFYIFTKKQTDFQVIFQLFTARVRSLPPGQPAVFNNLRKTTQNDTNLHKSTQNYSNYFTIILSNQK